MTPSLLITTPTDHCQTPATAGRRHMVFRAGGCDVRGQMPVSPGRQRRVLDTGQVVQAAMYRPLRGAIRVAQHRG
ncbi:MAG: hypothetical protein M3358_16635, partial [Actinomycetota bacterium]|nr:hypothetical protein [Actinomycetota bacterium]